MGSSGEQEEKCTAEKEREREKHSKRNLQVVANAVQFLHGSILHKPRSMSLYVHQQHRDMANIRVHTRREGKEKKKKKKKKNESTV
jgi:hypothetical protein